MRFVSAPLGNPAAVRAAFASLSFQPWSSVAPIVTITLSTEPEGGALDWNEIPCLVSKSFARSHSANLDHGPTKTWRWQSVASIVTGVLAAAVSSAGLT